LPAAGPAAGRCSEGAHGLGVVLVWSWGEGEGLEGSGKARRGSGEVGKWGMGRGQGGVANWQSTAAAKRTPGKGRPGEIDDAGGVEGGQKGGKEWGGSGEGRERTGKGSNKGRDREASWEVRAIDQSIGNWKINYATAWVRRKCTAAAKEKIFKKPIGGGNRGGGKPLRR